MIKSITQLSLIILSVLALTLTMACGDDADIMSKKPAKSKSAVKAKKKSTAGSKTGVAQEERWHYDPRGKRNPFKPFSNPDPSQCIAQYDLSQLRVKGVTYSGRNTELDYAIVQCPNKYTVIAKVGTRIGTHEGTITAISAGRVEVTEQFIDESGIVKNLTRPLILR